MPQLAHLDLPPRHPAAAAEVASSVLRQVVAAHEPALADSAGEPLLPCVGAAVAGKFVRTSKAPLTSLPTTAEWLLTCDQMQHVRQVLN